MVNPQARFFNQRVRMLCTALTKGSLVCLHHNVHLPCLLWQGAKRVARHSRNMNLFLANFENKARTIFAERSDGNSINNTILAPDDFCPD
jgi:hypothetical protein